MKKIKILTILIIALLLQNCASRLPIADSSEDASNHVSQTARDFYLKGLFLQGDKHYSDAIVQFRKALIFDTTSAVIYNSLAESYIRLNQMDKALPPIKKALKLKPRDSEALNLLGETYFRLHRDSLAIPVYEKIVKLSPYNNDARNFLSFLYEKNGMPLKKARLLENTLSNVGYSRHQLKQIADLYTRSKDYKSAVRVLNKIIGKDSSNADIYFYKGRLLEALKKPDSAIVAYKMAYSVNPEQKEYLIKLTDIYRSNRRFKDIVDLYRPYLKKDAANPIAALTSAESFYFMNAYDSVKKVLAPIVKKGTAPWGAYDLLGRIALDKKEYPQAIRNFKHVLRIDDKNRFGWLFLGFSYNDSGDLSKAEETFRQAVKKIPRDGSLWSWLGVILQKEKKNREAIMPFQQALALEPDNLNALSSLPVVYESLKMFEMSDSSYEMAIRQKPGNALLLNNFAYSLSDRGIRLNKAREMSEQSLKLEPKNSSYLDTMGWILYKLGNYKEAESFLLQALKIRPSSPVLLEHLGDIYLKLGDREKALENWQKSLKLAPDNKKLLNKINEK